MKQRLLLGDARQAPDTGNAAIREIGRLAISSLHPSRGYEGGERPFRGGWEGEQWSEAAEFLYWQEAAGQHELGNDDRDDQHHRSFLGRRTGRDQQAKCHARKSGKEKRHEKRDSRAGIEVREIHGQTAY